MINLLPPEEKQKNIEEKRRKVLIIFWFYGFFFLCVFSLVLFYLDSYVGYQIEIAKIMLQSEEKGLEGSGIKGIQEQIGEANRALSKVSGFYEKKIYLGDIIGKISEVTSEGIHLKNLSMISEKGSDENNGPFFKFSLSGFVAARETLFQFKKNLEADSYFQSVDFPTSNWTKPENIDFFVSFVIKK